MRRETVQRVKAPIGEVWAEIAHPEDLFKRSPDFIRVVGVGEDDEVLLKAHVAWGPITRNLDGSARVESAVAPHQLTISLSVPALKVLCTIVIDLAEVADDETSLHLSAQLMCGHRQISRLRGMLSDYLEDYVETTASRVATLAAQHWQSRQRLLFRPGPALG
jgi:carbon monoxide dehydrogenase subunit G